MLVLDYQANIRTKGPDNLSPLHMACQWGWADMVELLLELGAPVNLPSEHGATPLHMAVEEGYLAIVLLLL